VNLIKNRNKDATFNLAFEEYLLKKFDTKQNIVMFWQNKNAIIIGRNQDYYREINQVYVASKRIQVVRRLSGGGAVYQDKGNVNFTFITNKSKDKTYDFFLKPIIVCLNNLGIQAIYSGRNDITVNGKKISGNAQYIYKNRLMHHGTLLFDVNLKVLTASLNPDPTKLKAKGIQSVRARVTNIKPLLKKEINVDQFIFYLENSFQKQGYKFLKVDASFVKEVENLQLNKYQTDDWNIGQSPIWFSNKDTKKISYRFTGGLLIIHAQILGDRIQVIKFYGDFLSKKNISEFEDILQGKSKEELTDLFNKQDIDSYFGKITKTELFQSLEKIFDTN